MIPAARLQAAIEILDDIEQSQTPADAIIRAYFRPRRYAGSKDRRAVGARVFDVIRHRARLDWWIAGAAGDMQPSSRLRVLASLLILDEESAQTVSTLYNGEGHAPSSLSDAENQLADNLSGKLLHHDAMPAGVRFETPGWMDGMFQAIWGEAYEAEMAALNSPAPVDIRVNTGRVSRDQARKSLSIDNIKTEFSKLSPVGLRLIERARLEDTKAYKQGLVEVQDEGSQLISLLCEAKPGMSVIDYCAGAGGKTLALADAMGLQGDSSGNSTLVACDVSSKRMAGMSERLKRAGVDTVQQLILTDTDGLKTLEASAERVLVDVPCSGTGAWRRHPEARWRLTPERLKEHVIEQKNVLTAAAKLVKPGGRLIYATCSVLEEENDAQIDDFLQNNTDFSVLSITDIWSEIADAPCPTSKTGLLLSPAGADTDGFYCSILKKTA